VQQLREQEGERETDRLTSTTKERAKEKK